jgi:hypothetical protein
LTDAIADAGNVAEGFPFGHIEIAGDRMVATPLQERACKKEADN